MSPKTATNNRITTKLAKITFQLKPTTLGNSPTASEPSLPLPLPASAPTTSSSSASSTSSSSTSSSLSSSSLVSALTLPSSSSSAKVKAVKEVATAVAEAELEVEVAAKAAFQPISATTSMPTPTKIDPHSIRSFASASSTSVSMARMSVMKEGIMSYHNVIAMLTLLFLFCGLASVDGLKCYMCGQYNEGVGSITPCLNYSEQYAHLYLKDCPKSTEKFCVKYVSELSTVRDCATECAEKEIWETKTYCCNTDGCNGAGNVEASIPLLLMPVFYLIYRLIKSVML